MKKGFIVLLSMIFVSLTACSSVSSSEYNSAIETAIEYINDKGIMSDYGGVEREYANFMIWEDENNYYVLTQCNYTTSNGYDCTEFITCMYGKSNQAVSGDKNKVCYDNYNNNVEPLYSEENIELNDDKRS